MTGENTASDLEDITSGSEAVVLFVLIPKHQGFGQQMCDTVPFWKQIQGIFKELWVPFRQTQRGEELAVAIRDAVPVIQAFYGVFHHEQCVSVIAHTVGLQRSTDVLPNLFPGGGDLFQREGTEDFLSVLCEGGMTEAIHTDQQIEVYR